MIWIVITIGVVALMFYLYNKSDDVKTNDTHESAEHKLPPMNVGKLEQQSYKNYSMNGVSFNKREIEAILNIANGMAEIDGRADSIELETIYSQMNHLGISHEELLSFTESAILNMDATEAMNVVAKMTTIQKQYVQALLVVIMASDGEIHEREMIMLRMVTMTCGLPPINMNDIRNALNVFNKKNGTL